MTEEDLRQALFTTARALTELGLNKGTSGNVSCRWQEDFLITPSGIPAADLTPEVMVKMHLDGSWQGQRPPSSEWRFHRDIFARRPDAAAVIHTHSPFCTTLAVLEEGIPAFHYMVAVAGGSDIRCAPYATFGTQSLSDHALTALQDRKACLLGHHGMVVLERDLPKALALAVEVENLAEQYWRALQIRPPHLLSEEEMQVVLEKFKTYGSLRQAAQED